MRTDSFPISLPSFALDPVFALLEPIPSLEPSPPLSNIHLVSALCPQLPPLTPASNSRPAPRMTQDLLGQLSAQQRTFSDNPLTADAFGQLIDLVQGGTITCECRCPSPSLTNSALLHPLPIAYFPF